jgi:tetratricopeptide (TPR) repeat protein
MMYLQKASQGRKTQFLEHKAILAKAQQLRSEGEFADAAALVDSILESRHVGPEAKLMRAGLALQIAGPADAVVGLKSLLNERDEIACQAHFLLARIYLETAARSGAEAKIYQQKADEHQQAGEKLLPETAEAYFNRAMIAGTVSKTLEYLDRAIDLDRTYYDALKSRALTYHALRDYRNMQWDAVAMITLRKADPLGYSLMAIALRESEDFSKAVAYHTEAIELSPNNPGLYEERYETCLRMGDFQSALEDALQCAKLDPNNIAYSFHVFCAHTALGNYEHAQAEYQRVFQTANTFKDWARKYVFNALDSGRLWHPEDQEPEGEAFAAMHEADEYYGTLSQKAVRVAAEGFTCSWAPDGNELVYSRGIVGSSGIEIINVETGATRLLAAPGKDPAWSPDGEYIAYVRDRQVLPLSDLTQERTGASVPDWQQEIWLVRADGTEEPRFLAKGVSPSWGRDPKQVFYLSEEDARMYTVSTQNGTTPQPLVWFPWGHPLVSPDGRQVACVVIDRLCIADLFDKRLLYNLPAPIRTSSAAWLPDGKSLCVGGDEGLWIYDIRTQEASQIFLGSILVPRWSRDGRRLAFTVWSPYTEIWVADSNSLEPIQTLEQHYRKRIRETTLAIETNPDDRESYVSRA